MAALLDGGVSISGVNLTVLPVQSPMEVFSRMLRNDEFDIAEMSFTHCYILRQKGVARFVTLPVFPSRMFRHSSIFVNRNAVNAPKDLEGKRIGVQGYQMTAAVWIRGLLRNEYGVSLDSVQWIEGGVNEKGVAGGEATSFRPAGNLTITHAGNEKMLSDMLAEGEIDALIGAITPNSLSTSANVVRLFPNYHDVERDYFLKTGIFPIMHALVLKEEVYRTNRWLANNIYKACEQAKSIALAKARFSGSLQFMLPWLAEHLEEVDRVFGGDPWSYGVERNRKALDVFGQYLLEDGFLQAAMKPEDVFVRIEGLAAGA
jgi:4,5-dihydroxyphthalate decarboxylase